MKTLTAYFSASGYTASLAKRVAEAAGGDLFEIKPVKPYTDADLKWTNPLARCNREKIGKKDVPIADRVANFDEYDMVLIGFPVWYYAAPNIIETFVKSYDFSGKKVALFATSGGSDITKAPAKLQPLMKGEIVGAKLFEADAHMSEIKPWISSLPGRFGQYAVEFFFYSQYMVGAYLDIRRLTLESAKRLMDHDL